MGETLSRKLGYTVEKAFLISMCFINIINLLDKTDNK